MPAGTLSVAQHHKNSLAVMILDLDHFKNINDALGHSVGNDLLAALAGRLNRAKQDGRNCYRFHTAAMQAKSDRYLILENALRRALERGQLSLHYQPQMNLAGGHTIGAEALLRWNHPELGPCRQPSSPRWPRARA